MRLIFVMFSLSVCRHLAFRNSHSIGSRSRPSSSLFSTGNGNSDTPKRFVPKKTTRAKSKPATNGTLIKLQASTIAAIVDRNPYKSASEVFDELWFKHSPETFRGQTKPQILQAALDNAPRSIKAAVYASFGYKARDSVDAVAHTTQTKKLIMGNNDLSTADKDALIELVMSRVSMAHGARAEAITATKVEMEDGAVLLVNNKLYKYDVCRFGERQFQITGKIDRLEQQGAEMVLVEIKNRMNGLFREVREYEFIQVQTYLQMIPEGIQRAKLIEQYLSEHAIHAIQRDDQLWHGEILPTLNGFCERLHEAMESGVVPTVTAAAATRTGSGTGTGTRTTEATQSSSVWRP